MMEGGPRTASAKRYSLGCKRATATQERMAGIGSRPGPCANPVGVTSPSEPDKRADSRLPRLLAASRQTWHASR